MRTKPALFFAILLAVFLSSCKTGAQPAATLPAESMKGYELYSWQEGGRWKFSLLVGTNREKTLDEIQSADAALDGVDALRSALQAISQGQTITWSAKGPLALPPEEIVQQVEQVCRDRGLTCNIAR